MWLWLRPGLSGRDIDNVTDRIAAACWAASARVKVSPKRAAVVSVEVIRRDPLATSGQINSPLLDGVHPDHFDTDAVGDVSCFDYPFFRHSVTPNLNFGLLDTALILANVRDGLHRMPTTTYSSNT